MKAAATDQEASQPHEVFVSYSRQDKEFVRRLDAALRKREREAWVDWDDLRPAEEFMQAIYAAIESANAFVFVLTPDSLASEVCQREIAHAVAHNKRMIPVVGREVEVSAVPESLAALNWIFLRESDDFEVGIGTLIRALDTDLAWVRNHTRLLTRALEWKANGNSSSFALRGEDLRLAERWLAQAGAQNERQPTGLQTEYILASRKDAARRQRITVGAVSVGFVVALVLATMTLISRQRAVAGRERANEVIRFTQNDLPDKLRPVGRLDLMSGVTETVDKFYDAMGTAEGESVETSLGKIWVFVNRGSIALDQGRAQDALADFRSAVQFGEQARRRYPDSKKAIEYEEKARALLEIARQEAKLKDPGTPKVTLAALAPEDSRQLSELARSQNLKATDLLFKKQLGPAMTSYRAAQDAIRRLTLIDPRNVDWQRDLALSYKNIGFVLQAEGNHEPARAEFEKHADAMEKVSAVDPANATWRREADEARAFVATSCWQLVLAHFTKGELEAASRAVRSGLANLAALEKRGPLSPDMITLRGNFRDIEGQLAPASPTPAK